MIGYAILAFGSCIMAYADIKSKGYETHEWIAWIILIFGIISMPSWVGIVIVGGIGFFGYLLHRIKAWGRSDAILLAACCSVLPIAQAIVFPIMVLVVGMLYAASHVIQLKLKHKMVNMKERIPFLPVFPLAIILLWGLA